VDVEGHFTLWPSVKETKDSRIGREQKFVFWVFTLKANGQRTRPPETPTW
jgi:hypothetical protein